ncbi:phosphotransferase family protein [Flavilitoribacter nigricans]|uniref:Aminoglycoside phosphotransferase domain-containing protein n=1 Tax=Flavilitoribacter nigricans (strain ATCC 23147 / DSM 23189 / NBRC 102662 / NCIMB 1420 / SS-2) TaxID=1122177 RepID=A0A2D0MXC3_FLAN2|nr:aminoglycoside phosphotransferase family protein [Flavilitoribacter nigricans]PHN00830.1 hypothetical protein CRP01_40300 [Flavilitoribacter nigricans DSM 23189 = NBRC 102662]
MILTFENIAHYLLEKGLISLDSIIAGEFSVRDNSSRNTNFVVNQEFQPAYLIKQVKAKDREKTYTMRIEATCYWLANNDEQYRVLKGFLPAYFEYDYLNHILILELLSDTQSLYSYHYQAKKFPEAIGRQLAELLASYHTYQQGEIQQSPSYQLFNKQQPWIFSLPAKKMEDWKNSHMGTVEKQILQLIYENSEFLDLLQPVTAEWEEKSLIHGDVKFPNFLINNSYENDEQPDIRLIDWELADIGDPLWDVAAIFQNYLSLWVSSELEQQAPAQSRKPIFRIEQLQPSIEAFWERYTACLGWDEPQAREHLLKAVRFTALKLMHTCFEASPYSQQLQPYSAKMLQLSLNLLKYPDDAIRNLLGITKPIIHASRYSTI